MEQFPQENRATSASRSERMSGNYDPEAMNQKLEGLAEKTQKELDLALNKIGLDFEQVSSISFLEEVPITDRQKLSSLIAEIHLNQDSESRQKITFEIAAFFRDQL